LETRVLWNVTVHRLGIQVFWHVTLYLLEFQVFWNVTLYRLEIQVLCHVKLYGLEIQALWDVTLYRLEIQVLSDIRLYRLEFQVLWENYITVKYETFRNVDGKICEFSVFAVPTCNDAGYVTFSAKVMTHNNFSVPFIVDKL
jgi:hypothetical protein